MSENPQENNSYKDETKASLMNFVSELVNYIAVIATAIATMSLSIFMDLINSTCNLLRTGFCTVLSKRLQKSLNFKYNYGTDKLETLSMLFCDSLLIIGTGAVFAFAVYQLFKPREVSSALWVGVIFKLICVIVDAVQLIINWKVYRKSRTKVAKGNFEGMLGSFGFDFAIFASVLIAFAFKGFKGVVYVEPIISIIIAIVIVARAAGRLKDYIKELVNVTLDEEDQLKITAVLTKYFEKYENFYSVNSHKSGDVVCVDFKLSFKNETTYGEITETLKAFSEELKKNFEQCKVSIVIDE